MTNVQQADSPTLAQIKRIYDTLPNIQQKIADCVLLDPANVVKCSISDLTRNAGAKSEASLVRFYRTLGFDKFSDFKIKLAQELAGQTFYHSHEDVSLNDSRHDIKHKIFNGAMQTLGVNAVLDNDDAYESAIDLIMNAGRIVLLGYAASAAICYYAYFRFLELGFDCHFSSDSHINAAILTQPNPDDVIFCISYSGETRDIVVPVKEIAGRKAKVIALTGSEQSELAKMADAVIVTRTEETSLVTDVMSARISQMCTIDTLFSMVSIAKGEKAFSRLMMTRRTFYDYKK